MREPHVAVEVEAYRPFFILGEVTLPGQYPYVAEHDGGDRGRDRRRLHAARATSTRSRSAAQINGLTETRVVSPNYPVRPGDTIKVAERWF